MVAQNRSDPKPFKGKQDHFYSGTKPAGFSRLPHELFARNKHAGLYACKIFKKSHPKPSNLQEVKSHFVKARKLQHKVSSKVKNVKPFSAHKNHGLTIVQSVFPTTHSKNFKRESWR